MMGSYIRSKLTIIQHRHSPLLHKPHFFCSYQHLLDTRERERERGREGEGGREGGREGSPIMHAAKLV